MSIDLHHCQRCGHDWFPNSEAEPKICPKCKSSYWNKPRKVDALDPNKMDYIGREYSATDVKSLIANFPTAGMVKVMKGVSKATVINWLYQMINELNKPIHRDDKDWYTITPDGKVTIFRIGKCMRVMDLNDDDPYFD